LGDLLLLEVKLIGEVDQGFIYREGFTRRKRLRQKEGFMSFHLKHLSQHDLKNCLRKVSKKRWKKPKEKSILFKRRCYERQTFKNL